MARICRDPPLRFCRVSLLWLHSAGGSAEREADLTHIQQVVLALVGETLPAPAVARLASLEDMAGQYAMEVEEQVASL